MRGQAGLMMGAVLALAGCGKADEPAAEVNWKDGKAVLRSERNEY